MAKVKFNVDILNSIIKDFCVITRVSIGIIGNNFENILSYSDSSPNFCKEIQRFEKGRSECTCSDLNLLKKCKESKKTETQICHAGIIDAVVPIIEEENIMGYIMVGRMRISSVVEKKTEVYFSDMKTATKFYHEMPEYTQEQIKSILNMAEIMATFILHSEGVVTVEEDIYSKLIKEYIDNNLTKKLSVDLLCTEFKASKNYLYYKFRSYFGMTINEYIMSRRINRGRELLISTDYSVSRIAEEIGISNYTYFSKLFKDKYGIAPLEYRKTEKQRLKFIQD